MNYKNLEDITFQLTVGQLTSSSQLPKEDICVTISLDDMSKITCPGRLSVDCLTVMWNHPFLFSASSNASVRIAAWILPEELTHEWDKQSLGDQVVTNVASLLGSDNAWQCNIPGLSIGTATLFIICRAADMLIVPDRHDCLSALERYSWNLYNFGKQSKNGAITTTKIEVELARLDLCPLGHTNHIIVLNDLAVAFSTHYDQVGNIADLKRAIDVQQRRCDLCPLGHAEHFYALGELVISLVEHYRIQRNKEDLDRILDMEQTWLNLCPLGHPYHATALEEFARSLWNCYHLQKDIRDLDKAIEIGEKRLELCLAGHPSHHIAINNYANYLGECSRRLGNPSDLDRAIDLHQTCLALCPPGHQFQGLCYDWLG